jgi:adenosylcobinamide-phosphate synthase
LISPVVLILAFVLDLFLGDPRWLPHPVIIIGRGITGLERFLRGRFSVERERTAGVLLVIAIVLPTGILAFAATRLLLSFSNPFLTLLGTAVFIYLVSTTLALRGLVDSARLVIRAVESGELVNARQKLSMIVGRDTDTLGEEAVLRATIETVAENLSDGFVAPLFYLVLGGLPLAMAYKAINTLDSMVGYKNRRYIRFGWAAARLDDVANYVPARITGFSIAAAALVYFFLRSPDSRLRRALARARDAFRVMVRDGRNHTSPNSGVSEAAMAGALRIRLGGPATYGGSVVIKPYIGDDLSRDHRAAAGEAVAIASVASSLAVALAVVILVFGRIV